MGMWSILEEGRGYEGFNERGGRELEMAYMEGCEHGNKKGYEAAMREMQGGDMGFRGNNGGSYGVDPYGEEEQYLRGYIGQKMFLVAKKFLCECCRKKLIREIHGDS